MTISRRSRLLFLGSTLAPISILIVELMYRHAKEIAHQKGATLLTYHPGFLFTAMALVGATCFIGALISTASDSLRARKQP